MIVSFWQRYDNLCKSRELTAKKILCFVQRDRLVTKSIEAMAIITMPIILHRMAMALRFDFFLTNPPRNGGNTNHTIAANAYCIINDVSDIEFMRER